MRTKRIAVAATVAALGLGAFSATALAAPPPNDDFANATELAKLPTTLPYTTVDATNEAFAGETDLSGLSDRTVWHRFIAPLNGTYAAETMNSPVLDVNHDPHIHVYSGTCSTSLPGLTLVAENDDFNFLESRATWTGVAGTVYWVRVRGHSAPPDDTPSGDLKVTGPGFSTLNSCTPPPPNCPGTVLVGTGGNDTFTGGSQPNSYNGLGGMDNITGGSMDDLLCGGPGADTISGGSGNDDLYGDGGADNIGGGSGADDIIGGAGPDVVSAGGDADDIFLVDGVNGNDKVDCGSGFDQVFIDPGDQVTSNCEAINP